jgi:hypothetical protein
VTISENLGFCFISCLAKYDKALGREMKDVFIGIFKHTSESCSTCAGFSRVGPRSYEEEEEYYTDTVPNWNSQFTVATDTSIQVVI